MTYFNLASRAKTWYNKLQRKLLEEPPSLNLELEEVQELIKLLEQCQLKLGKFKQIHRERLMQDWVLGDNKLAHKSDPTSAYYLALLDGLMWDEVFLQTLYVMQEEKNTVDNS